MSLQNALLGVLDARPMSGYELARFFDNASGWLWAAPHSQIYPALRQMERAGLVVGTESVRGSRLARTVYSLTPSGRDALTEWISQYHEPGVDRDAFAVQALLFDMIEPAAAERVLTRYAERQRSEAERYEQHAEALRDGGTALLRERLRHRPEAEHQRISALKAHVFTGKAAVARERASWADAAIELLAPVEAR